ncbi:hypothetical protein BE08_07770 [Sorangium cellulosum]|uniref:Uncharacterized protein n=1 Tax=Sorangium cellulosum TaxID=56 RepID=A0A150PK61_SORCE|nr:hypothetical protein BE08_07770 [Sorangium cellulosum]
MTSADVMRPKLLDVMVKTLVTHSVTYMVMGLLASSILDYTRLFAESSLSLMMRPTSDPWVMVGPLLQPLRGVMFGVVFHVLRGPLFERKNGWMAMWLTLVVLGIFGTFGPAPGSMEGMIYTVFPPSVHLRGLPEVVLQSLLLSLILVHWVNNPQQRWLHRVMWIAFAILMSLPILGLLAGSR